jgi:hypothetical protein
MAKKVDTKSLIHVELNKLEAKIHEFQQYLEINPIITKVTGNDIILLPEDAQSLLHKEIAVQIKIQDALFNWMPLLEKLRETDSTKPLETRGDIEINGLFAKRRQNNGLSNNE